MFLNHQLSISKRFSTWVLLLFVVSWMNLSFQAPAHAAMQQKMQTQTMHMENMTRMDMQQCHCPPALCDAVLSVDDQSTDGYLSSLSLSYLLAFLPMKVSIVNDRHQPQSIIRLHYLNQQYHQTSPPPLSRTSTLLI